MRLHKRASKRQSTRHVEGIKKKVAAHHRKQRKISKKDPTWRSKSKKDPGIPAMFPYKDKILQEIEDKKQLDLAEKLRKRQEWEAARRAERIANGEDPNDIDNDMDEESETNPLAALLESAEAAARDYENDGSSEEEDDDEEEEDDDEAMSVDDGEGISAEDLILNPDAGPTNDTSRKTFDRLFTKVVDAADVILYVLDARDPQGTRSKQVEHEILSHVDKRLIFVLNKIDLVPKESLNGWVKYLSNFFPTVPVRASTSSSSSDTFNHGSLNSSAVSASNLLRCLKSFANKSQLKRSIVVGVIGYPNVGKSSIINALVSRHGHGHSRSAVACPVGAEAGVTTSLREIKIDNKLRIIDSPGIVFPAEGKSAAYEKSRLVLMSALPPKQIDDPISAATLILKRIIADQDQYKQLEKFYNLPALVGTNLVDKASNFLLHVARNRGRIGKKGIPNLESAAMCVINDWRDSRITRWTEAPKNNHNSRPTSTTSNADQAGADESSSDRIVIVKEWAKEFSLDDLLSNEPDEMQE